MARSKATRGPCAFCGKEYTRWGMTKHLQSCTQRSARWAAGGGRRKPVSIYHLLVQDAYGGDFWLHLEIPAQTTLTELDEYLRAIWLECCGHLSAFEIGGIRYTQLIVNFEAFEEDTHMDVPVGNVFQPGLQGDYSYDFGSTTELTFEVAAVRQGAWTGHPVLLMARNAPLDLRCGVCDKAAEWICTDCIYESDNWFFCEEHLLDHEHEDETALAVANSPRMGTCAYDGPAIPPY